MAGTAGAPRASGREACRGLDRRCGLALVARSATAATQLLQDGDLPAIFDHRHRRRSTDAGAGGYVMRDMRPAGHLHAGADLDVADDAGLAAHHHEVAELSRA